MSMISVIIPAYNAAKTIERALMSAIRQIPDGEIIVVENGCSDNTESIVNSLSNQYQNIKLIHSSKGVSAARNAGIVAAKGNWIMFLDADDYFEDNIRGIVEKSVGNTQIDLWLFGHYSGKEPRGVTANDKDLLYVNQDVLKARTIMLENPTRYMEVWSKLFKASIIKGNNLLFNESLSLAEDSDFSLKYTKYCNSICFSHEFIYHYSLDASSTMRKKDGTKVQRYILSMEETKKAIENEPTEILKAFNKYVLMHFNIAMVREVFVVNNNDSKKTKEHLLKKTAATPIFKDAISGTKMFECMSLRMIPVLCLKLHFYTIAAFIYELRAKQNNTREGEQ